MTRNEHLLNFQSPPLLFDTPPFNIKLWGLYVLIYKYPSNTGWFFWYWYFKTLPDSRSGKRGQRGLFLFHTALSCELFTALVKKSFIVTWQLFTEPQSDKEMQPHSHPEDGTQAGLQSNPGTARYIVKSWSCILLNSTTEVKSNCLFIFDSFHKARMCSKIWEWTSLKKVRRMSFGTRYIYCNIL